jgi:hypothetical protein
MSNDIGKIHEAPIQELPEHFAVRSPFHGFQVRCSSFSDEQAHAQDAMEILDNEAEVDVANAVARIQLCGRSVRLGDVEDVIVSLHPEIFSL